MPRLTAFVEVTAHRGAAAIEPENTLRGFRYALSLGVQRIELDVHLSCDQQLIVMHDARVDRTTNGSGAIAEMTADEIRQLDAGMGERVPLLPEVIDLFQAHWQNGGKTKLQIELKGPQTAAPTVAIIQQNNIADKVVLSSFDETQLAEAIRLLPPVNSAFLTAKLEPDPLEIALRIGAGGVHLNHNLATREWVDRVHAAGLHARVWNIDEAERMKWAIDLGVDGIGSNNPQLLLDVIAGRQ